MAKSTLFKDGNNYGELILLISLLLLTPLIVLPFYPEETEYAYAFLIPAFFSAALGLMIFFGFRDKGGQPARPEFMSHMRSGSTLCFSYGAMLSCWDLCLFSSADNCHSIFRFLNQSADGLPRDCLLPISMLCRTFSFFTEVSLSTAAVWDLSS